MVGEAQLLSKYTLASEAGYAHVSGAEGKQTAAAWLPNLPGASQTLDRGYGLGK
jgi:hypothetical protein